MNKTSANEYFLLVDKLQRANRAVLEANFLASEMRLGLEELYLSLAIPAANFNPKFQKKIRCIPYVYINEESKRIRCVSIEDFERLLCDARDALRNENINRDYLFGFKQPKPTLIGVCNLSLQPLLYDIRFYYPAPVFGTQGEIIGYLKCELKRLNSHENSIVQIGIREVSGVPYGFSDFVFCQYTFPDGDDDSTFVLPVKEFLQFSAPGSINFNHLTSFDIRDNLTLSQVLPIEIWGHKRGPTKTRHNVIDNSTLVQQVSEKWRSYRCLLMLSVGINELNEHGVWNAVIRNSDQAVSGCGGFYKIKQGQSHMFTISIKALKSASSLKVTLHNIDKVEIGCIRCCKSLTSSELDSYTDDDLCRLREMWLDKLEMKRQIIQTQIAENNTVNEQSLIDQLVSLTEERNIVELPPEGSGIPGSPADWSPPPGVEKHTPLLLLQNRPFIDIPIAEERSDEFISLTNVIQHNSTSPFNALRSQCHWDATAHESAWLNQISDPNLFVFLIMRIYINLQVGFSSQKQTVVLRKRIPVQIVKRNSNITWMSRLLPTVASLTNNRGSSDNDIGVVYDLIHDIPATILESQPREKLAQLAAQSVRGIKNGSQTSTILLDYLSQLQKLDELLEEDQNQQAIHLNKLLTYAGKSLNDILPVITTDTKLDMEDRVHCTSITSLQSASSADSEKTIKVSLEDDECQVVPTDCSITCKVTKLDPCRYSQNNSELVSSLGKDLPSHPAVISNAEASKNIEIVENRNMQFVSNNNDELPLVIGQTVQVCTHSVNSEIGIVQYIGPTIIRKGLWVGIELNEPVGKNDGTIKGRKYFTCKPNHGVFVRPDKLRVL